jgi:hypothetical protein
MIRRQRAIWAVWMIASISTWTACGSDVNELSVSTPDRAEFTMTVYPILLRDCAFFACHSSTERFLQVFGPGRGRLSALTKALDPELDTEIMHAYDRARSMIDANDPDKSLLLRKPLEVGAGGTGHQGADHMGRNVYQDTTDPSYVAIRHWVLGSASASASTNKNTNTAGSVR